MEGNQGKNHGKNIGNIIHSTLQSGDLSRLKDLGPAIEDAVKDIPVVKVETRNAQPPAVRKPQAPHHYPENAARWSNPAPQAPPAPWKGSGQRRARPGMPKGIVETVFGVMGMVAFGLGALVFAMLAAATTLSLLPFAVGFGVMAGLSAMLLGSGLNKNRMAQLAKKYYKLLEKKPVCTVVEMAAETGREPKKIRKDFKRLRRVGMLTDVRMDPQESSMIRGEEAWQLYLASQKSMAERAAEEAERQQRLSDPATAGIETFKEEGAVVIKKIRAANDAIPGEEISGKLSTLETTCTHIFTYVEKYPEKLPDTRKFMSYYLPTTLKLVEKYRQFEAMEYQPDNVRQTKEEIERSLDTINVAFSNMLESLFQHETLDVSTDIEVLEKMLEQEGLTGRQFEVVAAKAETAQKHPELTL